MSALLASGILIVLMLGFISLGGVVNGYKNLSRKPQESHRSQVGRYREETNVWLHHR